MGYFDGTGDVFAFTNRLASVASYFAMLSAMLSAPFPLIFVNLPRYIILLLYKHLSASVIKGTA